MIRNAHGGEFESTQNRTLAEQAEDLRAGIKVVEKLGDIPKEIGRDASAVLFEEEAGPEAPFDALMDYAHENDLSGTVRGTDRKTVDMPPAKDETERRERVFSTLLDDINSKFPAGDPDARPHRELLLGIVADAKKYATLFPEKKLTYIEISCNRYEHDEPAQIWHQDTGTYYPNGVRILKTYCGPGTEFADDEVGTNSLSTKAGTVSVFPIYPKGAVHRAPPIPAGQTRVLLFMQFD
ncbi:MAG: hypothetical protein RLZZ283_567 [Candidatus Parcubacteria bacterium]|jgi:hypothetical protein